MLYPGATFLQQVTRNEVSQRPTIADLQPCVAMVAEAKEPQPCAAMVAWSTSCFSTSRGCTGPDIPSNAASSTTSQQQQHG